jgi:hypothetical protein
MEHERGVASTDDYRFVAFSPANTFFCVQTSPPVVTGGARTAAAVFRVYDVASGRMRWGTRWKAVSRTTQVVLGNEGDHVVLIDGGVVVEVSDRDTASTVTGKVLSAAMGATAVSFWERGEMKRQYRMQDLGCQHPLVEKETNGVYWVCSALTSGLGDFKDYWQWEAHVPGRFLSTNPIILEHRLVLLLIDQSAISFDLRTGDILERVANIRDPASRTRLGLGAEVPMQNWPINARPRESRD